MLNPQRQYGADVVERGNYVLKHGPEQLYRCIRRAVSDLLAQAAEAAGRTAEDICPGSACGQQLYPPSVSRASD